MNQLPLYPPHPDPIASQNHGLGSQSLLISHQQSHHPSLPHPGMIPRIPSMNNGSPRPKLEAPLGRPMENASSHSNAINSPTTTVSSGNGGRYPSGSTAGSSGAAPGPIPASTPLVVRQDMDGVQWILFEYSKNRSKMEYTIRCDVESVDTKNLDVSFKQANCIYPRAYCELLEYKGNRYGYENDCNGVGWALAELNHCLREKRGLIQRAVDSWRNSNSDSKLRSRRVRRIAKARESKPTKQGRYANTASHMHTAYHNGGMNRPSPTTTAIIQHQQRQGMDGARAKLVHHHYQHEHPPPPPIPHGGSQDVSGMFHHT